MFTVMLYIFRFLHQTTTYSPSQAVISCCISFVSYIKPQRDGRWFALFEVVYLSFPTSNHNTRLRYRRLRTVVYLSFPTSNHNFRGEDVYFVVLYIFRFLHQTTTLLTIHTSTMRCISFVSYIKPQLLLVMMKMHIRCISFVSYIKPQLTTDFINPLSVVYLSFPTSNHNTSVTRRNS